MEIDAYDFADKVYNENSDYFANICQKQVEMYKNMIYTGTIKLDNYDTDMKINVR
jgi:hypothetical protein